MADINAEIKELSRIEEAAEAGDIVWQMQLARWYEKRVPKVKLCFSADFSDPLPVKIS